MTERAPNVFVLTVDSLRADVYDEFMDDFASAVRGVEFTNAFATASNTGSSMPTLAAGVFCDRVANGTPNLDLGEQRDADGLTTLAEALTDRGYDCWLWSDNVIFGSSRNYNRGFEGGRTGVPSWKKRAQRIIQRTGSDRVFNACRWAYFHLLSPVENALPTVGNYNVAAGTYHRSVLDALERASGGQMHWIHYMDVHHPFEPPAEYLSSYSLNTERSPSKLAELSSKAIIKNSGGETTDADIEDIERAYLAACEHLRDQLLDFVETLVDRDHYIPGHDVFVLTADHGEGFDRDLHGILGHTPTPAFWDDIVRVPLLIGHPDWEPGTVDCQVSLIDLAPTILRAVGAPVPASFEGVGASRPANLCREHVFFTATGPYRTYHGLRNESGWKLFADRISDTEAIELTGTDADQYHERVVLTEVDDRDETVRFERPLDGRTRPSDGDARENWRELHDLVREREDRIATRRFDTSMTAETAEQLRQMGYVDNIR